MYLTNPNEHTAVLSLIAASNGETVLGGLLSKSQKIATLFWGFWGDKVGVRLEEPKPSFESKWQNLNNSKHGFWFFSRVDFIEWEKFRNLRNMSICRGVCWYKATESLKNWNFFIYGEREREYRASLCCWDYRHFFGCLQSFKKFLQVMSTRLCRRPRIGCRD